MIYGYWSLDDEVMFDEFDYDEERYVDSLSDDSEERYVPFYDAMSAGFSDDPPVDDGAL